MSNYTKTIQAVSSDGTVLDERSAETPAGARRSLLAMIDRHCTSGWVDGVSQQVAESAAAHWDGRSDFKAVVGSWNRTGSVIFHACERDRP